MAFQNSRDLSAVIGQSTQALAPLDIGLNVMTPCLPMLVKFVPNATKYFLIVPFPQAEVCKSVDQAMQRCPNGMLAEIKYDGERVQVHKSGNSFSYFSRSLKPVLDHKVLLLCLLCELSIKSICLGKTLLQIHPTSISSWRELSFGQ